MKRSSVSQRTKTGRSVALPILAAAPLPPPAGVRKSRTSRWRAASLITLTLLMIAHYVQWRMTGVTVSPIEPSETMYTLQSGAVNAGFIFFTLAILATLIFGRFVCGWGCHIVALQDFCAWLLKKIGLKPRPFRSRLLVFAPVAAALYMFIWPTASRLIAAPKNSRLIPEFSNHIVITDFWATFPTFAVAVPFLFICGFVTVYFLGSKGFCTYACPYGGVFGIVDKIAPGRIRVTDACNECGHCTAVCTSNVIVHAEVKQFGMVVDPGCMKCMDCVSVCPTDALYFGFGKPAVVVPKNPAKTHTLTWPEEILAAVTFAITLFAVWDAYQLVPMLMALGVSAVTSYLLLRTVRLFRAPDQSFYKFNLKANGAIRTAGWAFAAFATLWIGLIAHSGWVHYHESAGTRAFQALMIPDELALARPDPAQWLSPADRTNISEGKQHLQIAVNKGFFVNADAMPKLAWLEYLSGNTERSIELLSESAAHQTGRSRALSLYYKGAILNRLGRFDAAITSLDEALEESPELVLAHEEKGESLWQLGRRDEALASWYNALKGNPDLPLANYMLAGANASMGQAETAAQFEGLAARLTPSDPYFHWMLGLRLQNVGMSDLAEKHFAEAVRLDPSFRSRRLLDLKGRH